MFVFWKKISSFLDIHWQISGLLSDCFSAGSSKLLPTCPEESFEEKHFSEIYCFPSFQDGELKRFGLFWKISAGLSKKYLTCPSKHSDEQVFFKQKPIIFGIQRKNCGFLLNVFRLSLQKWILAANMKIMKKFNIVRKKFITFETLSAKSSVRPFVKKNLGLSKQHSTCPWEHFDEMFFLEKNVLIFFGKSAVIFWPFVPISFGWVVKVAFYVSMGKFWRIPVLKKIHPFQTLNKFFPAFCWISFSGVFKTAS